MVPEELNKLLIPAAFEAFGDVGHNRNRSSLHLISQSEIFKKLV